jgi:hypothetical protein
MIYLIGENDDGMVHFLDELPLRHSLVPQIAQALAAMLTRHGIEHHRIGAFVAGHDCFSKESSGRTIADSWRDAGWTLEAAIVDRKAGAAEWLRRLGNDAAGVPVTVQISKRCSRLIETIPMLLSDPRDPEDVLKVDCDEDGDGGDDPYDGARYGLMQAGNGPVLAPAVRGSRPLVQAMQRGLRR